MSHFQKLVTESMKGAGRQFRSPIRFSQVSILQKKKQVQVIPQRLSEASAYTESLTASQVLVDRVAFPPGNGQSMAITSRYGQGDLEAWTVFQSEQCAIS